MTAGNQCCLQNNHKISSLQKKIILKCSYFLITKRAYIGVTSVIEILQFTDTWLKIRKYFI